MSNNKQTLLRAAIFAAFVAPLANAADGPYVGIESGVNVQAPQNVRKADSVLDTYHFKNGFAAGLVGGYAFQSGWRPEVEIDYRRNKFKYGATGQSGRGVDEAATAMLNGWYDIRRSSGLFSVFHPYIGGGVGGVRFDNRGFNVNGVHHGNDFAVQFGYQGGAGLGYDVRPDLTLSLDYRYLQSYRHTFVLANYGGPVQEAYRSNSLMLGVRYSFGTPPPPAPPAEPPTQVVQAEPAPPPPPEKVCVAPPGFKVDADCKLVEQSVAVSAIDFEFNSATLTEPAQQTLDQIAPALAAQPELAVEIQGHTDSIGSARVNMKLSQQRAEAVKTYLVGKGVNGANLTARGYGKTRPIASNDTAEGRAQNRRVEFDIRNAPADVKVHAEGASPAVTAAAQHGEPEHLATKKRHHNKK